MTYILGGADDNVAVNFDSITVLHNSTTDIACSVGTVLPLQSSRALYGSDTYSVSSGVFTLPSGFYYLLRGGLGVGLAAGTSFNNQYVKYRFYNTGASAYVGRRGTVTWQETPLLTAGDDYAIALIDASSSSQTIDFRVTDLSGSNIKIDISTATSYPDYAGYSRVEIWKWS